MFILGISLASALLTLIALRGFALYTGGDRVVPSSLPQAPPKPKSEGVFILNRIADVVGRPFTGPMLELLAPWRTRIRRRIDAAGRPGGMTVESYARQTAGMIVLFGGLSVLMFLQGKMSIAIATLVAMFQNEFLLYGRAQSRKAEIEQALPDFLDVLAVTVTAGLSFRTALARVVESMPGALAEEFRIALRQMELGTPRRDAFEDLRTRNNSQAIGQFVTALLQAEELGAPLSTALMDIAADMRRESAQWARRRAQRMTPRITAATTALTLPAMMLVIVGSLFFSSGLDLGGLFG
ncbi:type II secretion system F family protein [Actinocorallia aurantiaca]|uniref:DUF5936 domain-containing protein n=1 Tax=Actinocorallia aurantiaca TaxID=46204 RepID=A0ABN3U2F7_9ACTN